MISSVSNVSTSIANLASLSAASSTASTSSSSEETLLESELAAYTQELAEASAGDGSTAPGALNAQQLQQQIASIQQQLDQLNSQVYAPTSAASLAGSLINTFA